MSGRIVVLSEEIANKIAAGEVVERPASILIIDNGAVIEYEDVAQVFDEDGMPLIDN